MFKVCDRRIHLHGECTKLLELVISEPSKDTKMSYQHKILYVNVYIYIESLV